MNLKFEVIAHNRQRYETVGDWYKSKGVWWFKVSRMKDKRYVWLVFIHEFIEWAVCQVTGVKQREVDRFDREYEEARPSGGGWDARFSSQFEECAPCGCKFQEEAGDDIHAPYHEAHTVASQCERLIAKALNVDWVDYCEKVDAL
jgi:hypothetical protein